MVLDRVNSGNNRTGTATTAGVDFHNKRIQAGLSTQIVIQVTDDAVAGEKYVIGAIQSLNVTEERATREVYELGTDAIVQIVPISATTFSLDIDRIVFDFQRLPQALQREYRHIHAQRRAFDIVVTDYNPYLTGQGTTSPSPDRTQVSSPAVPSVNTVFGNCWFTRLSFSYKANDYLITESCQLKCEYIKDDNAPQTVKASVDQLERDAATSATASILSAFDSELPT
jgi:hypothetical protein